MSGRIILHSDMNNCYASIEQKLDPALAGKPLIVCGSRAERHGIVLAKSMEAKACGIVTGEPIWQAREKCPGLVEVSPHFDALPCLFTGGKKDLCPVYRFGGAVWVG